MAYRQAAERAALSIEEGTANVPADGKYYVIHEGAVIGCYRFLRKAQEKYRELMCGLLPPTNEGSDGDQMRKAHLKAMADAIVDSMEMETFAEARRRNLRRHRTRTNG